MIRIDEHNEICFVMFFIFFLCAIMLISQASSPEMSGRYSAKFAPRNMKIPRIDNYYNDVKKDSTRLVLYLR